MITGSDGNSCLYLDIINARQIVQKQGKANLPIFKICNTPFVVQPGDCQYTQKGVPSPTATSPKRREIIRNLALSLWAAGHKSPDLTVGDNDLRVRSPRGGRSGTATCPPGRSAQGRLPRVRTPADRPRTPVGWSWNPTCGSRTSRRPEPSS